MAPPQTQTGQTAGELRRWFVGIGVGDYDDAALRLHKAVSDVGRMSDWFVTRSRVGHTIALPALSQNPKWSDITEGLHEFLDGRSVHDVVVIYVACHGDFDNGEAYLFGRNTPRRNISGVAVSASELGRMIGRCPAHNVLLIIDTCVAGTIAAAISDATHTAVRVRNSRDPRRGYAHVIIASAFGLDSAVDGEFVDAFLKAVGDERWTGTGRPWIELSQLVQGLNAELAEFGNGQIVDFLQWANGEVALIPNPNCRGEVRASLFDDIEFATHFDPAARGVSRNETGLFFTGRTRELAQINDWLRLDRATGQANRLFVITGSPGSGKSALLSRVAVLSKPDLWPAGTRLSDLPSGTVPPPNAIDGVVWCHGKTRGQVIAEIGGLLGGTATNGESLLGLANAQGRGKVFAIDALDEAAGGEARAIASEVVAPLVEQSPVRLLVATRRHSIAGHDLVGHLDLPGAAVLDLDRVPDRLADMEGYVRARLRAAAPGSSSSTDRARAIDGLAKAIAEAAGPSFLVASIAARSAGALPGAAADYKLPAAVGEALAGYLDRFDNAARIRQVLRPIAWSHGAGQPWGTVWSILATALAEDRQPVSDDDIKQALEAASDLVVEADDAGEPVYRLFHEALAEHLRETTPDRATAPERIARALLALTDGRTWPSVPRYCRNNLPMLLVGARLPDELARIMLDPAWAGLQRGEAGRHQDSTRDVEAAARLFADLRRPLDLAPLCHQYGRATSEALPPLVAVLGLSGQQRRAEVLAGNLTDVVDRMLAFRDLAIACGSENDLAGALRCAEEVQRTLPAMPVDHLPMAWAWAAQAHAAAQALDRASSCADRAYEAVEQTDDWDRFNGRFWAAMAARAAGRDDVRRVIAADLAAMGPLSFRNQALQAAAVAGGHDLLRQVLEDLLALPAGQHSSVRPGSLALALADAGLFKELDALIAHLGAGRPQGEDDSIKRWAWALALAGRLDQALAVLPEITEPIERSKALARIAPHVAKDGHPDRLRLLRAAIDDGMVSGEPRTKARLVRALWAIGAREDALAALEREIEAGARTAPLMDSRAEPLEPEIDPEGPGRKVARRAMTTSRAPVADQVKADDASTAAAQGRIARAHELAQEILVPRFKAQALAAIARNEPDTDRAMDAWCEALILARRAGRGEVEKILDVGPVILRRAGRRAEAAELDKRLVDTDAKWQLELFVDEYGAIRQSMASGPDRTRILINLMLTPRRLARERPWSGDEVRAAWVRGEDGSRLFAIGLMQGNAELIDPAILSEAIRGSRSAFEQFNALKAVHAIPEDERIDPAILQAIGAELAGEPRGDGSNAWLKESSDRRVLAGMILNRDRTARRDQL